MKHVILAVDDDRETLDDLSETIDSLKCVALDAGNQSDALKVLKSHRPCMMLLDLQIKTDRRAPPQTRTGFNLLRRVRQQYPQGKLPVILISAHVKTATSVTSAFREGIDDYVGKPFEDDALEGRIRHWLNQCPVHGVKPNTNGTSPGTDANLYFDGTPNKGGRHLLKVLGKDVYVRPKTVEVLWALALERLKGKGGWLKAQVIASSKSNPHEAITRARQDLKTVCDPGKIIENNRGQYRLVITAERIRWNDDTMKEYFSHLDLPPGSSSGDKPNAD